jgi:hypothetical protein
MDASGVGNILSSSSKTKCFSTWAAAGEGARAVSLGKEAVARDGRMHAF